MQFLNSLLGGSDNIWLTAAFALGAVLVAIVLLMWLLRLFTGGGARPGRGRNRRIAIVDSLVVDPKRTLLIVRRDNVEHLILTGGPGDVVVETGIPVVETTPARPEAKRPAAQRNTRSVEPAAPVPVAPAAPPPLPLAVEDPSKVTALDRLRELGRPVAERRPAPRHPGLMRPVSQTEPTMLPQANRGPSALAHTVRPDSAMNEAGTENHGQPGFADSTAQARAEGRAE